MRWAKLFGALLAVTAVAAALAGCDPFRERTCSAGEYPVWSVQFPESGGACVSEGKEPMRGYARYPTGLVPEFEDQIVTCPAGKCKDGPLAIKCPKGYPSEPCTIAGKRLPPPSANTGR